MFILRLISSRMSFVFVTVTPRHNGELHDLYGKPDIMRIVKSRRLRWAGHVTRMGNERGAWKLLVGKPEGKRPLGRPRMRWENNIKHDLREVDYTGCFIKDYKK